ncbi:hypothetical protein [Streptomyces sp. 8N706]|uniref:hypothetical protein n=1 Tax=Streptomyces sp. 8N706 TaxID=3457416 RepID=UPI003FCF303A
MVRQQQQNEPLAIGLGSILFAGLVLVLHGLAGPWVAFAVVAVPSVVFVAVQERRNRD